MLTHPVLKCSMPLEMRRSCVVRFDTSWVKRHPYSRLLMLVGTHAKTMRGWWCPKTNTSTPAQVSGGTAGVPQPIQLGIVSCSSRSESCLAGVTHDAFVPSRIGAAEESVTTPAFRSATV